MADYAYPISEIPGGQFTGGSSAHLQALIPTYIPNGVNPNINSDDVNVTVTFDEDLSGEDQQVLGGLVARSADYFIITMDGGKTDLGNPAVISKPVGPTSSTTVTLQYKSGDGKDSVGYSDQVKLDSLGLTPIDKSSGTFDAAGKVTIVMGASITNRGRADVTITTDTVLPKKLLRHIWV